MSQERDIYFRTADMLINSNTGEVSSQKQKRHLSPVNSRVLNVLLQEAKKAVSRQQLFDGVWPNQVVSDDALTRSICLATQKIEEPRINLTFRAIVN